MDREEEKGNSLEGAEEALDGASSSSVDGAAMEANGGAAREKGNGKKVLKPLSRKRVEKYNEAMRRRGVIYISRVPPAMKPAKAKHLLEQFGAVSRIYLVEEDAAVRKNRKRAGGRNDKRYMEGWVEFEDKAVAKAVAASLNNTAIGGRKRDVLREDLWNIKYLRHFKWDHLTEKVAYERRVREQKLRLETMQARRENALYAEMVEKGKVFQKMEERKDKKRRRDGSSGEKNDRGNAGAAAADGAAAGGDAKRVRRRFSQARPAADAGGAAMDAPVLAGVFGSGGR